MAEEQAYIVFDGSNKPLPWPPDLHGQPTRIFKQSRSGGWEAFLKAVEKPRDIRGIMIAAPPQSLSIMVSGLKAHYPQSFLDLMKLTLVLLTEDEESAQVEPLKRLYGFRTLVLSSWSEDHLMDFVGNIFQPPLENIPELPHLEGGQMAATQMVDYYQLIGLQKTATQKEIHAALGYYREYWSERARNPETRPKAEYSLALISQAEALLLEPIKRERYDSVLDTVRTQPKGKGLRGTRRLDTGAAADNTYQPTAWTRDAGFTSSSRAEEPRPATREPGGARDARAGREPGNAGVAGGARDRREKAKDDRVYRPPAWTREERDLDYEQRANAPPPEKEADPAVYQPPSWSRRDDEFEDLDDAAASNRDDGDDGDEPGLLEDGSGLLEHLLGEDDPAGGGQRDALAVGDAAPGRRATDPADPEAAALRDALDDPDLDLKNLPGLGKRREDPGGDPWPPRDWPPKGWVGRESQLAEDAADPVPVEEDHAPVATDVVVEPLEDQPVADLGDQEPHDRRTLYDPQILTKVPAANPDIEVWASSFMALEPGAAFPAEAGMLIGTRFEVSERQHYVVSGTYSLGGEPPSERVGYYVQTKPHNVIEAAEALEQSVGAATSIDLALAVDLATGTGRFFKVGASKRPFAVSPIVRLSSWQAAPPGGGDRLLNLLRRNRWTVLATAGILFLGAFTFSLYRSLGDGSNDGMPPLERLAISSYIRADGVVLKWVGAFDKVAIYRIDAGDSTAHWKLVSRGPNIRMGFVDPDPVRHPGRYRYLVVATSSDPRRTLLSEVQALDVR